MSVAMGMAHPFCTSALCATRRYKSAGAIVPPRAATRGKAACRGEESSPSSTSRFISSPTRKKKTAMRPSLIHSRRVSVNANRPKLTETGAFQIAW